MEKKYVVLIVDDREENRLLLRKTIESMNWNVQEARNGLEALKKIRKHIPDLIISDVLMPVMDGFTLCKKVKQDDVLMQIPFVFYSSTYVEKKDEEFALSLGAEKYLIKPVEPIDFIKIIKTIFMNLEKGKIKIHKPVLKDKEETFKLYSERLVNKLEKKLLDLEKETILRIQNEEKLEKSHYYLTKAQKMGSIGTWELDLIKNELIWTDQNYINFGVPIGTPLTYEIFLDCIYPDDREYVNTEWMAAIDGKPYDIEHRLIVDGEVRWVREKANIEFDKSGKAISAIGFTQDITKRKHAEKSLKESEMRFKALHNASFGGIAIHDKGLILDCNQGLAEMSGYSVEQLIGMDGLLLIAEESREMVMGNILSAYEKPYEAIGQRKNREQYPIRLEAKMIPYKGKDVQVVEFRDITEQKQTEQALKESEEQYRSIIESTSEGCWILNTEKVTIDVNDSLCKMLGYSRSEIIGKKPFEFTDEKNAEIFKLQTGKISHTEHRHYEITLKSKSGKDIHAIFNATTLNNNNNEVIKSFAFVTNIAEHKKSENDLKKRLHELEILNTATVGRELKINDLRKEINDLLEKLGEKPKYKIIT